MTRRVIVIGLDGLPKSLLDILARRNSFRNIKGILKNGAYHNLRSVLPPSTAPAWISFATGVTPKTHQCYSWVYPKRTINDFHPIDSRDIELPTFYELLHKNGRKCILINMPASFPPKIEETVITGLLTKGDDCFFPKQLKKELTNAQDYKIVPENIVDRKSEKYIRSVREVAKARFKVARELFEKKNWDFFFLLFGASDWIQHGNYIDLLRGTPRTPLVWKVYEDLDRYIGWFRQNMEKNDILLIMSDHGFTSFQKVFFINTWLRKRGLLFYGRERKRVKWSKLAEGSKEGIPLPWELLLDFLGKFPTVFALAKRVYFRTTSLLPLGYRSQITIDSRKSKCFYIGSCIYLNDRKRFKDGMLNKNECLLLKSKLINAFRSLKIKGTKVLTHVRGISGRVTSSGRILPDIIVFSESLNMKGIRGPVFLDEPTQDHSMDGIFIGYGGVFKDCGALKSDVSIIDLAPTILELLGVAVPSWMEGRSLLR